MVKKIGQSAKLLLQSVTQQPQSLRLLSVASLLIITVWIIVESVLRNIYGNGGVHLKDWPFTACFLLFLVTAPGYLMCKLSSCKKYTGIKVFLAAALCILFVVVGYLGFLLKDLLYGRRVYSDLRGSVKSYFSWSPDGGYYEYDHGGLFLLINGEPVLLGGGDMGSYTNYRKQRYWIWW